MLAPITVERFNHATLNVRDLPASIAFYTQVLGFHTTARPAFDFEGAWLYRAGLGMMLHLIVDPNFNPPRDRIESRKSHLAFRVTDVDAAKQHLHRAGVPFVEKLLPTHGYRQLFLHDPSGNVLELGEWPDPEILASLKEEN